MSLTTLLAPASEDDQDDEEAAPADFRCPECCMKVSTAACPVCGRTQQDCMIMTLLTS